MGAPTLVVLAGGASSRLGTCKALVRIGDRSPLEHLLAAAAGAGFAGTPLVVGGRHHAEIEAAAPPGVQLVQNASWERGRTGSIQAAVAAAPGQDLCLAPVDVPLVPASVFGALVAAWRAAGAPDRGWLAPHVAGSESAEDGQPRRGHPVLLGRNLLGEIALAGPDRPLRSFRSLADPVWSIPVAGNEILDDLDGPDDLARLRDRTGKPLPRQSPPTTTPPP